mgnify:FL=1
MDVTELAKELQALQRGRGLERPRAQDWVGPQLRQALKAAPDLPDAELRELVTGRLVEAAAELPRDLRYLFLSALGLNNQAPMLKERLALVAAALNRDPRTLSRRLRHVEELVAARLAEQLHEERGTVDPQGWLHESVSMFGDLSVSPPRVGFSYVSVASRPLDSFVQVIGMTSTAADAEPGIIETRGCRLRSIVREAELLWAAYFDVDPTPRGARRTLSFQVTFPELHNLAPFLVLGPVVFMKRIEVGVDLGEPPVADAVWLLDRVPTSLITDIPHTRAPLADPGRVVRVAFDRPQIGFAHGLAWRWAR